MNRDVKILGDIQGPKFRCSLTENDEPVPLKEGEIVDFVLATGDDDVTRGVASLALSSIPAPSARGTSAAYVPEVRATARSPIRRRSRASTSRCR